MTAYYNEHDAYAAQWLRNLISAGHIAPGDVDERSIVDVQPDDLRGYTQAHFFAGIGGWSLALRLAMFPDDRPVWTGSCPCQPFSAAGKQRGTDDERHLWPVFRDLIAECRPATVFGEQVASKLGRDWLGGVRADLEALGYAVGAADLCAAGVGAPHIRQRLWWVADADGGVARHRDVQPGGKHRQQQENGVTGERLGDPNGAGCEAQRAVVFGDDSRSGEPSHSGSHGRLAHRPSDGRREERALAGRLAEGDRPEGRAPGLVPSGDAGGVADADLGRSGAGRRDDGQVRGLSEAQCQPEQRAAVFGRGGADGRLGHADDAGPQGRHDGPGEGGRADQWPAGATGVVGFWGNAISISCSDGKARRIEPGIFPLAHGVPGRVGKLRAAGNAIVPQVAAAFIRAAA